MAIPTPDQNATLDQAVRDHKAGRLEAAESAYRLILARIPYQPDALHLLGLLACDRGDGQMALTMIDAAITQQPGSAAFHHSRARALTVLGRLNEAEAAYRIAWQLRPDTVEIANNLGCLLYDRGDLTRAMEWLSQARKLAPTSAEVAASMAGVLAAIGASDDSLKLFQEALLLDPDSPDIRYKLGRLLSSLDRPAEAEQSFRLGLRLRRDHAPSHNGLGLVLQNQGHSEAAIDCFKQAVRCDPGFADAHYNLGCLLSIDLRIDEARMCYNRALASDPLHGPALWARCLVELPVLYATAAEVRLQRARYKRRLDALVASADEPTVARSLANAIGASQPFFLPYQGECDRTLQSVYGALVSRLLSSDTATPVEPAPKDGKLRLGIVSGFFREHTIWWLILRGWLSQLDRGRFSVCAYHTARTEDEQTAAARLMCDRFVGARNADVRAAIVADQPHALLYPELGMDPGAARLAGERLAPVQCVSWGQPETSGLPTIDFFLSSALMEPAGAASHYTEQLVTLPNLGIHYTPVACVADNCSRSALGFRASAVIFWCGQALYKYLPQYDDVFARIAAAVGDCQFLFIGFARSANVTECFRSRLRGAFTARGLNADWHCVFMAPMSQERFIGTVAMADIVLDSIGWSGGKSTLDALAAAPVIVTHSGRFMRGRHTGAILTLIGVAETIARTVDDFVAISVRLARDPDERAALRERMVAGRHRVMADVAPIRALEVFLGQAVGTARLRPNPSTLPA